jgi:orotate phosphoribosyltransferase
VITRGGRVQETIDIIEGRGGRVAAVAVLVDRSGGKTGFKCPTVSLLRMEPVTYAPAACPLCAAGQAIEHPGS